MKRAWNLTLKPKRKLIFKTLSESNRMHFVMISEPPKHVRKSSPTRLTQENLQDLSDCLILVKGHQGGRGVYSDLALLVQLMGNAHSDEYIAMAFSGSPTSSAKLLSKPTVSKTEAHMATNSKNKYFETGSVYVAADKISITLGNFQIAFIKQPIIDELVHGSEIHCILVRQFFLRLIIQYIQTIENFGAPAETDWISGKTCFMYKVENMCKSAYEKTEPLSTADKIACAIHVTNALSLCEFEKHALSHTIHHDYKQVMLFTCFLLGNQQFAHCFSSKMSPNRDWYDTKCDIMRNYLHRLALDKGFTKEDSSCWFLMECAELVRDGQLVEQIKKILMNPQRKRLNFRNCSASLKMKERLVITNYLPDKLCTDATIYDRAKDPPGQRSVYIPPGDRFKESYRLSTFIKYPQEVPINPRHLASAGFYYTGYKDRVKCFSCGLGCENWVYGDDARSLQWHRSDCDFAHGGDSGNVPIGGGGLARFMMPLKPKPDGIVAMDATQKPASNFTASNTTTRSMEHVGQQPQAGPTLLQSSSNQPVPMQTARPVRRNHSVFQIVEFATIPSAYHENFVKNLDLRKESERLRTFEHWPLEAPTVYPADLAKSGFFYLGNLDRVQCFSCGGVLRNWNYGDQVQSEHRRHFPHCKLCQGAEPRNVPLMPDERAAVPSQQMVFHEPPDPTETEARDLRDMFQCQFPVNPHMQNEGTRFETFDHRWPSAQVNATPQQIAKAGFFFLGDGDRVKCWYCNGGLQNWDPQDEPWTEHAKWFPTCEFLLQRKGPDFVHRLVSMFPNLPRPLLRGPFDVPPANPGRRIQYGTASYRAPSPPPPLIDPQADLQRERQKIQDAMNSEMVKIAIEMGFERKLIRHVVKRRIRRSEMCRSVAELVDDITGNTSDVSDSDEDETSSQPGIDAAPAPSHVSSMESEEPSSSSMQARIQELQEERKCKVCLDNTADIVFVPCGHLCCCGGCAGALRRCPMCRRKIEKAIRTYVS